MSIQRWRASSPLRRMRIKDGQTITELAGSAERFWPKPEVPPIIDDSVVGDDFEPHERNCKVLVRAIQKLEAPNEPKEIEQHAVIALAKYFDLEADTLLAVIDAWHKRKPAPAVGRGRPKGVRDKKERVRRTRQQIEDKTPLKRWPND